LVGPGTGTEFGAFRRLADDLPDVRRMLLGDIPIAVPEEADRRYALCSAAGHLLRHAADPLSLLGGFLELATALPSDFACLMVSEAIQMPNPEMEVVDLLSHPGFADWRARHGAIFDGDLPVEAAS